MSERPDSPTPRHALLIVFLVVFIDLLGFGIVLPLLPIYADSYVVTIFPKDRPNGAEGAIVGLLMASFSAMQFIFAPIWGRVSDRIGRRPILLLGLVGSVVFYTLFGYASDLPVTANSAALALTLLFVARSGAGIAGATISTAQAVIADCTTPERRKHGMALVGIAFGFGFTFGPLIGAGAVYLLPDNRGATGYFAAALSALALGLGIALLPETRRFGEASAARTSWLDTQAIRAALLSPRIAPVLTTFFLGTLGFGGLEVTQALLNRDALGLGKGDNFLVFAFIGFVLMLAQGLLYRRLAARVSETTFIASGLTLMAIGVSIMGFVAYLATAEPSGTGESHLLRLPLPPAFTIIAWEMPLPSSALAQYLAIGLTLAVTGFALLTPSAQALISRRSDQERQGEVLGVSQSASAMARIVGPPLWLWLYKATESHLMPYIFGVALLLGMLALVPAIRRGGDGKE